MIVAVVKTAGDLLRLARYLEESGQKVGTISMTVRVPNIGDD